MLKELTISTTFVAQDLISDILYRYSHDGVNIEEELSFVKVKAYFDADKLDEIMPAILNEIETLKDNAVFDLGLLEMSINDVNENLWYEEWKKDYRPIDVGNIKIIPNWLEDSADGKISIKIDPNQSFGSGEHESTQMCLEFLQEIPLQDKKVVDVGCGSGILAIAAKALGADVVEAYDIDENAVKNAKKNAKYNGYADIKVGNSNKLNKVKGIFDVVVANITSEVLKSLAKDLDRCMSLGGCVIISGILVELEKEVIEVFLKLGFNVQGRKQKGEWVAFRLTK